MTGLIEMDFLIEHNRFEIHSKRKPKSSSSVIWKSKCQLIREEHLDMPPLMETQAQPENEKLGPEEKSQKLWTKCTWASRSSD
ncbi:MAG: hypothetical protein Tsb009_23060 [Planctomycetaceae bacterium]